MPYKSTYDPIIEKVRSHSGSYGSAPYAVTGTALDDQQRAALEQIFQRDLSGFDEQVAVLLWTNYELKDLEDHIRLSEEYAGIAEKEQELFLADRLLLLSNATLFRNWREKQALLAGGIIIQTAMSADCRILEVPDHLLDRVETLLIRLPDQKLFQYFLLCRH